MASPSRSLLAPVLLAVLAAGCDRAGGTSAAAQPSSAPASSPRPGGTAVVAEIDGAPITQAEVDARAQSELQRLEDQQYEIRRRALDQLISEKLVAREAMARGVDRDTLFRQEIEDKVGKPTAQEVDHVWELNKHRVGARTKEELRPNIERSIVENKMSDRMEAFQQQLREKAKVRVLLQQPRATVQVPAGSPETGPAAAPVTIVEFSDYLCPFCQRAEEVVQKVMARHEGKVKFVHVDYLIGKPRSLEVARAARCAGDQGKFWEYRQDLLLKPGDWTDAELVARARKLGLEAGAFQQCVTSRRHDQGIQASTRIGEELGVTGTPTFFVNGRRMVGVRTERQFDEIIAEELGGRS